MAVYNLQRERRAPEINNGIQHIQQTAGVRCHLETPKILTSRPLRLGLHVPAKSRNGIFGAEQHKRLLTIRRKTNSNPKRGNDVYRAFLRLSHDWPGNIC